jgi:hypothetical protein
MTSLEHRRIDLTAAEWERLDNLAKQTRSRPTSGAYAYQPSWRALIKRIAAGDIEVVEKEPYKLPAGLEQAADLVEQRQQTPTQIEMQLEPA